RCGSSRSAFRSRPCWARSGWPPSWARADCRRPCSASQWGPVSSCCAMRCSDCRRHQVQSSAEAAARGSDAVEMLGYLAVGFAEALTPLNIALALTGCFIGTIVGALPGLGPVNGVAILIPLAFSLALPPGSALILLACVYYGC